MIRFFRSYRKTVMGILIFFVAALLMTSFGVDFSNRGNASRQAAIVINDQEITHREFFDRRREIESRYRQMFGANFETFTKQFGLNIPQQVVDAIIAEKLILQELTQKKFATSDDKVVQLINTAFPGGYDAQALRNAGKTPQQFLNEIREDGMKEQFQELLKDASLISNTEARALALRQNTLYDLSYVQISAKDILPTLSKPSAEELSSYFDERKSDFELPARVSYEYVVFSPDQFLSAIEVAQDEVEFHYTDNQDQYEIPEALKARHIQFLFPKDSDPKKLTEIKNRAKEALEKAKAGEKFESLVSKYSDDAATKSKGGDLGWVARGSLGADFDDKAYKVKDGGISELIETDAGFHIVKVEGYREATVQPLEAVRGDIELMLKKEQAPAYADTKAREFFDLITRSDSPVAELAKAQGFTLRTTSQLLTAQQNPDMSLAGLTEKILENSFEPKQLIDLKDKTVVVSILEAKEPEIPALESIKDQVTKKYLENASLTKARELSDQFLTKAKSEGFSAAAKSLKLQTQSVSDVSSKKEIKGFLSAPQVRDEIFSSSSKGILPEVYSFEGNQYIAEITAVKVSTEKISGEEVEKVRTQHSSQGGDVLTSSVIDHLKARAKITIDNSIFASDL